MTNHDQNHQEVAHRYDEFSVNAWLVASSEGAATVLPSNLIPNKGVGELNNQVTTIIKTDNQLSSYSARQGPTGPRTEVGKKRSSQNAIKYGIFAKATLLKGESRAEYESLRERVWKGKQPGDEYEELLLDMFTSNVWRQIRGLVAENAGIQLKSEFLEIDSRRREQAEAERIFQGRQPETVFALEPVDLISNIHNPFVFQRCIELLLELQLGIKTNGFDEEQDRQLLKRIYREPRNPDSRPPLIEEYSTLLDTAKTSEEEREREGYYTPEECKRRILREISLEIKRLERYQRERELIESKRRKLEILLQRVPDSPGMDRLLRSRNSLEREFYRLLAEYDRAQRIRKGQPLPPQLDVKIS